MSLRRGIRRRPSPAALPEGLGGIEDARRPAVVEQLGVGRAHRRRATEAEDPLGPEHGGDLGARPEQPRQVETPRELAPVRVGRVDEALHDAVAERHEDRRLLEVAPQTPPPPRSVARLLDGAADLRVLRVGVLRVRGDDEVPAVGLERADPLDEDEAEAAAGLLRLAAALVPPRRIAAEAAGRGDDVPARVPEREERGPGADDLVVRMRVQREDLHRHRPRAVNGPAAATTGTFGSGAFVENGVPEAMPKRRIGLSPPATKTRTPPGGNGRSAARTAAAERSRAQRPTGTRR